MKQFLDIKNEAREKIKKHFYGLYKYVEACFWVWVLLAFASLIVLIFNFSLYTLINPLLAVIWLILIGLIVLLLNRKGVCSSPEKNTLTVIFAIWVLLQLLVVINVEVDYYSVKEKYSEQYVSFKENGLNEVNATWSVVDKYSQSYQSTYGKGDTVPLSRRIFKNDLGFAYITINPILSCYFLDSLQYPDEGYYKLVIVQNSGACGEFASSMKLLIHDASGFDTRVIAMEGKDHGFPEVKIGNEWWVFDKVFTTPYYPVKASTYASYVVEKSVFASIHDLHEHEKDESLLAEHGFNASNLTISAILSLDVNEENNELASGFNVEIFAYNNSYDPLVDCGETDKDGKYSTRLRSEREYFVIVKDKTFSKSSSVGFENVYLPDNNTSITVYLHKYE